MTLEDAETQQTGSTMPTPDQPAPSAGPKVAVQVRSLDVEAYPHAATAKHHHLWEWDVYGKGLSPPPHQQVDSLEMKGLHFFGRRLFTNEVSGTDALGRKFTWTYRRSRKSRKVITAASLVGREQVLWFDWLHAARYHDTVLHALNWWIAFFIFFGAIFFIFGSICLLIRPVSQASGGRGSRVDWLVNYPFVIGSCLFFTPGVFCLYLESLNAHLELRVHNWTAGGCVGKRPGFKLIGCDRHSLSNMGSLLLLLGANSFNLALITTCVSTDWKLRLGQQLTSWLIWFPKTFGAAAFVVGRAMISWEHTHRWWRGFIPLSRQEMKDIVFWANFAAFWGASCFLLGSAFFYDFPHLPWGWVVAEWSAGYLLGAILFCCHAFLLWVEVCNPNHRM